MDLNNIYPELFYLDKSNGWKLNVTGHIRLRKDYDFANEMIEAFDIDEFAFIKEQLKWLEKDSEFSEENFIQNVPINDDINVLSNYLEDCYNNENDYEKDSVRDKVMEIINNSSTLKAILNKIDGKHKDRAKGISQFNKLFEICELPFIMNSKRRMKNSIRSTVWIIGKNDR